MMATRMFTRMSGGAVVLALLAAHPGWAQDQEGRGKFVLTPYAGVFVAGADMAQFDLGVNGYRVSSGLSQKTGLALGANANYWLNDRVSLELGGAYVMSDAEGTVAFEHPAGGFSGRGSERAHLWLGTAKVMLNLMPATSDIRLRLGVGPAIISRGGAAFKSDQDGKVSGLTDFGGAVSLCTRIPIAGALAVRLRGESYLYQTRLKFEDRANPANSIAYDREFQSDFVFSAGLQFAFKR